MLVIHCCCHIISEKNYRTEPFKEKLKTFVHTKRNESDDSLTSGTVRNTQVHLVRGAESFYENVEVTYRDVETITMKRRELTDLEVINILNKFGFIVFFIFIIWLNLACLIIFPYYVKTPLTITP